jgi:hypothetical protein
MDRYTNQDSSAFQPGRVTLDIEFVAIASGDAPAALSSFVRSEGIIDVTLAATGVYTVLLQDSYVGLARGTFRVQQATYSASAGAAGDLIVNDVSSGTSPSVTFQCFRRDTGAAVAVVEGDTVRITLELLRLSAS